MTVGTILAGFDGTEQSTRALERAIDYAQAFGARLVVLTVEVPELPLRPPGLIAPIELDRSPVELARERAESVVAQARALAGDCLCLARVGDPTAAILDAAGEHGAELIVLGSSEAGFLERVLGGGVGQDVVRQAGADVLIVS